MNKGQEITGEAQSGLSDWILFLYPSWRWSGPGASQEGSVVWNASNDVVGI